MRAGPTNHGGPIILAACLALATVAATASYAVAAAIAAALIAVIWPVISGLALAAAGRGSVVYRLVDNRGTTLYVGSTSNLARRLDEHLEQPDPWRRHIHAAVEHRLTATRRQATRIEQRMIRAFTLGAEHAYCLPLHNEIWAAAPPNPITKLAIRVWLRLYVCQSILFRGCTWAHPNGVQGCGIVAVRQPASADRWDLPNDDPPPDGGPIWAGEATYERNAGSSGTSRVTHPDTDPFRGRSEHPQRDAPERPQRHTPEDLADDGSPPAEDDAEPANERRRRLARERQARHRARRRGDL